MKRTKINQKRPGWTFLKKDNNNNAADCKLCTLPKEILQG